MIVKSKSQVYNVRGENTGKKKKLKQKKGKEQARTELQRKQKLRARNEKNS